MKGVLLVNMGGVTSEAEMKTFLKKMFMDPYIIPLAKPLRKIISLLISNTRYKRSWKKYEGIGGTPILKATEVLRREVQQQIGINYKVALAYSYAHPYINESLAELRNDGVTEIKVIPLYPQTSYTTTSSVIAECKKALLKMPELNLDYCYGFYRNDEFIAFWESQISKLIEEKKYKNPKLVFSAHSIPLSMVKRGDKYPEAISLSARNIATKLGLEYEVAYQSGMRSGKWLGPDTTDLLDCIAEHENAREIIIVPISFVSENLETLYDIDKYIIPFAIKKLGIKNISRVMIPEADPVFVKLIKTLSIN